VLSDPEKKAMYDQYGEEGVGGAPSNGGGGGGGGGGFPGGGGGFPSHGFSGGGFPGGGGGGGMQFSQANADDIFRSFFGTSDPFSAGGAGGGGMGGGGMDMGGMGGMFGGGGMGGMNGMDQGQGRATRPRPAAAQRKAAPIQHDLKVSLEDLYNGGLKKVRITKKVTDASGRSSQIAVEKEIQIKAGWKDGTKITYEREGDESPGVIPADIIFVIVCKPHPVFTREGDDLHAVLDVPLEDAMRGVSTSVKTLDGRSIAVREPFATPQTVKIISGEGMMNNKTKQRGNLVVKYNIIFPLMTSAARTQIADIARSSTSHK
jgi:DnaJ family protein B protein 4